MPFSWQDLVAALESPQGVTFYVLLALLLLSAASLWLQSRQGAGGFSPAAGRALAALMVLRLLQGGIAGAAWWGEPAAAWSLPAVERALHLLTLVLFAWLWAGQPRSGWLAAGLLAALAAGGGLLANWMGQPDGASLNYSPRDYAWGAACLLVLAVASILVWRRRSRPGLFAVFLLLLGQVLHMLLAEPYGNMPLITQLAHLLSLPLLAQLPLAAAQAQPGESEEDAEGLPEYIPGPFELNLPAAEPEPAEEAPPPLSLDELAKHVAQAFGADLCVFAQHDGQAQQLQLSAGYNLLRDTAIQPADLALANMPQLQEALEAEQPLKLSVEDKAEELSVLSQALSLSFPGYLLAQPLQLAGPQPWAALLLNLTRPWSAEDEAALQGDAEELAAQLAESLQLPAAPAEFADLSGMAGAPGDLQSLLDQLEGLSSENQRYRQDVDRLLAHIDQLQAGAAAQSLQPLQSNELVQALQMENERLKQSLHSLEGSVGGSAAAVGLDSQQAREELRLALQEVATLHEQLAQAQQAALLPAASLPGEPISSNKMEVIASIAQELRQPLSSVLGYTDLLLGESVGILGALQRKFLERVRHSTERMNTLIDNLIRIAELDEGGYSAQRKPVELGGVIDDAVGQLRPQFQEKRIALRVDLPEQLPELNTDRDALQQILYHLLQNADAATPAGGEITLRAFVDSQAALGDFALIQVSDSGGGIPEDELPRVFSRVYRASNPVIPGVGDSGVGLTIAETLTQALGGRIWVETEPGVGATFSILLPLDPAQTPK